MTATVGGLWDSLLAEGKPWWITANSDSHVNYLDVAVPRAGQRLRPQRPLQRPGLRRHARPTAGDFWPGFYSRTHVGADRRDYRAVMDGLRDGPGLGRPRRR